MILTSKKIILLFLGWICVILGAIGALLPIIPTTPFLLLAAYFFSKGSAKLHAWILNLPTFGPIIKDWEDSKTMKRSTKYYAIFMIILLFGNTLIFVDVNKWIKSIIALIGMSVIIYITKQNEKKS